MTTRLIQKHLLKGTREFEIVDDAVNVRISTPFKPDEELTVMLTILNPEPVINKSYLEFHSRVKCGPLLSLFINKPTTDEFNAFVSTLRQRAQEEYSSFAGINPGSARSAIPAGNVAEEPPEFDEIDQVRVKDDGRAVSVVGVESSIELLQNYLPGEELQPFIAALQALKAEPDNEACLVQVVDEFNRLGIQQGAVLTYAPYVNILLSDDPFGEK